MDIKVLSDARGREGERRKYINALGHLYPDRDKMLTDSDTFEKLKEAVKNTPYEHMLASVTDAPSKEKGKNSGTSK